MKKPGGEILLDKRFHDDLDLCVFLTYFQAGLQHESSG
jgi:hypothetical protein